MRAARLFAAHAVRSLRPDQCATVEVDLEGSLGATGIGHGTDRAVILGLLGHDPRTVALQEMEAAPAAVRATGRLLLDGHREVSFAPEAIRLLPRVRRQRHPNSMTLRVLDRDGTVTLREVVYSIGGGFIEGQTWHAETPDLDAKPSPGFTTGDQLLELCARTGTTIAGTMRSEEERERTWEDVRTGALEIWEAMRACIEAGCRADGTLPGGLRVRRRAAALHRELSASGDDPDPLRPMDWVSLFALAVNEENAAGGRVVTAPTNGAAGILPAVLAYYVRFIGGADDDGVVRFLLAAAAIGSIIKHNASIAGAEVGCQGEVGSACAMAAAGLTEVLGGSPEQVENAAEIAIEHHLGLTCDPIGGLVQIPCIERNAIGATTAINASRIALRGDGTHRVTLDEAIRTMRQTGADMHAKYKETSLGGLAVITGLAVNRVEC